MGNSLRRSTSAMSDDQISTALTDLGDASAALESKVAAFEMLRSHFVRTLNYQQKLAAIDALNKQRYTPWPPPPSEASSLSQGVLLDKIRGLIFGAALGDAVGLATEFLNRAQVESFYGGDFPFSPKPSKMMPDTHRMMWAPGDWTDDTDQLILILQSLLQTQALANPCDFAQRLAKWRQHGFEELGDDGAAGVGQHTKSVILHPDFLTSPHEAAYAVWEAGGCRSGSNGAVMRCAIGGVPYFWSREVVLSNTTSLCRVTHADPRCIASCVLVAVCVSEILRGRPCDTTDQVSQIVASAVDEARVFITKDEHVDELTSVSWAESLRGLSLDEPRAIGYTFKCLGAALWAFRSSADFVTTIRQIVAEGGDADTNCCVAGALMGCRLGFSQLPSAWIAQLEHPGWLEAHVQKLLFMLRLR